MNGELWSGDCLEMMGRIPGESVDLILCDLPYGTTRCRWDTVIPLEELWAHYKRIIRDGGAIVLTASQPFTSALGASNLPWLKYSWYWRKSRATGHLNAKKMPMKEIEDILVFYQSQPVFNPQGLIFSPRKVKNSASHMARGVSSEACATVTGGIKEKHYEQQYTNYPRQVLDFASEGATLHPTQKPVSLFEYLIRTYSNEGDLVLDNCAGSFTTAVACQNTKRNYICIEKDPTYFEIGTKRVKENEERLTPPSLKE